MRISVRLNASLRRYIPADAEGSPFLLDVEEGATVTAIMDRLGVPAGQAHMVTIDGEQSDRGSELRNGQELSLFPPLAGGV